jgi:predicted phage tail protein
MPRLTDAHAANRFLRCVFPRITEDRTFQMHTADGRRRKVQALDTTDALKLAEREVVAIIDLGFYR